VLGVYKDGQMSADAWITMAPKLSPSLGASESVKEPNWTMIAGWVEGPNGSIMYRVQGPDAIINTHLAKIDQLLASMKPNEKKQ